ncbi:MAG: hypothetical protein LBP53_04555 [Candidatus Peribacteria bacterium]|jgi:hypothetical protein|nr:hypothetical protein [Candidatus Peribacteria bacterium]
MSTFAVDIKTQTVSDTLIQYADQAIAKGTSVDTLITAMKTIHEQQKSDLAAALAQNNLTATQTTLNQRNEMYPLTNHLYDIKAGSGKTITNASGVSYTFKKQAALPWLNISR